jgi:hypothetical protein
VKKSPPLALTNERASVRDRLDPVRVALWSWLTVGWLCVPVGCGGSSSAPPIGGTSGASDNGTPSGSGNGVSSGIASSGSLPNGASSGENASSGVSSGGDSPSGTASSGESNSDASGTGASIGSASGDMSTSGSASGTRSSSGAASSGESSSGSASSGGSPVGSTLNPDVAPGGNFNLSTWELQEPVGSPGSPTTITPGQLKGPTGFHDSYFFTDPTDGSMTFWDPENGVTTSGSDYPRSELREMTAAGGEASWQTAGTNTLSATVKVSRVPDHVCVGQIHTVESKPLLELFYFASGAIVMQIEQTPAGGDGVPHTVGSVPLGSKWSYVIGLAGNAISLSINGGASQGFAMSSSFDNIAMYFKAGDYDQSAGSSSSVGAQVQFYALTIRHE